jgi:hypothetical protein
MVSEEMSQLDSSARARARARWTCQTTREIDRASFGVADSSSSSHLPGVDLLCAHRPTAVCDRNWDEVVETHEDEAILIELLMRCATAVS